MEVEMESRKSDVNPLIVQVWLNWSEKICLKDLNNLRQVSPNLFRQMDEVYYDRKGVVFQCMDDELLNKFLGSGDYELKKNWDFREIYRTYKTNNLEYAVRLYDLDEVQKQVEYIAPYISNIHVCLAELFAIDPYLKTLPVQSFAKVKKLSIEVGGTGIANEMLSNQMELLRKLYEGLKDNIKTLEIILGDDEVNVALMLKFVACNTQINCVQLTLHNSLRHYQVGELDVQELIGQFSRPLQLQLNITINSFQAGKPEFIQYLQRHAPITLSLSFVDNTLKTGVGPQMLPIDFSGYQWNILETLKLYFWKSPLPDLNNFPKLKTLELHKLNSYKVASKDTLTNEFKFDNVKQSKHL